MKEDEHTAAVLNLGTHTHLLCMCGARASTVYKGARAVEDDEDLDGRGTE